MTALRAACAAIAGTDLVQRFQVNEGEDDGGHVNFLFSSPDVRSLWAALLAVLYNNPKMGPPLSRSSLAVCEGGHGWDDYHLLAHWETGTAGWRI